MAQQAINFDPATGDDTTGALRKADNNIKDLDGRLSALGNASSRNVGTTAGTVAAGDDSRFAANAQAAAAAQTTANAALPKAGKTSTRGLALASGAPPNMAGIESSSNSTNLALNVTNDGNGAASAAMSFLREGSSRWYLGLDTDNTMKVANGNSAYRLWHEGNTTVDGNNFIKRI